MQVITTIKAKVQAATEAATNRGPDINPLKKEVIDSNKFLLIVVFLKKTH